MLSLQYSLLREDYDSDTAFANFRVLTGGNLKENTFYRSCSPCTNRYGRAKYANQFLAANGIRCCLNMANSEEDYKGLVEQYGVYDYEPYATLYQEENVIFSPVRTDFQREDFAQVFCPALLEMTEHEGPYLIHCDEGINRTGFACVLLLALAGASQEEIVDDYMVTYDNYYGIREAQEPERYAAIREYVYEMFTILTGEEGEAPLSVEKLREGARNYLLFGGLTQEEISRLEEAITK